MLSFAETGQVGVDGRHRGALVAKVDLDLPEVLALLKQVRRVTVAQRVDVGVLFHTAGMKSQAEGPLKSRVMHRLGGGAGPLTAVTLGGEQERGMTMGFPQIPQQMEGAFGQGHVTILIALAGADVQEHAFGIDVADLEPDPFAQAQAAGVDGAEANPMIQDGNLLENLAHFPGREHDREFELRIGANQLHLGGPAPSKGFFPEQFDGADRLGRGLAGDLLFNLEMEEVLAEFLGRDLVG